MTLRTLARAMAIVLLAESIAFAVVYAAIRIAHYERLPSVNAVLVNQSPNTDSLDVACSLNTIAASCRVDTGSDVALVLSPTDAARAHAVPLATEQVFGIGGATVGKVESLTVTLAGKRQSV